MVCCVVFFCFEYWCYFVDFVEIVGYYYLFVELGILSEESVFFEVFYWEEFCFIFGGGSDYFGCVNFNEVVFVEEVFYSFEDV